MTMTDDRVITQVYVFGNGMVMVFDQHGKQMPDYQGVVADVMSKITAVYDGPFIAVQWP
jgi:hypothetical protein